MDVGAEKVRQVAAVEVPTLAAVRRVALVVVRVVVRVAEQDGKVKTLLTAIMPKES